MSNLDLYNAVRQVPEEAKKTIGAGRLKGMTDINPMWRIKTLTEQFGPCGKGWKVENVNFENIPADKEIVTICTGTLYYRIEGEWSDGVFGVGGSKIAVSESKGTYIDDEAYKKAYTDMLSVACKSLGIGADVYWDKDRTKYSESDLPFPEASPLTETQRQLATRWLSNKNFVAGRKFDIDDMTSEDYGRLANEYSAFEKISKAIEETANATKKDYTAVYDYVDKQTKGIYNYYNGKCDGLIKSIKGLVKNE